MDQFSNDLSKVEIINSHISKLNHSQLMQIEEDLKIAAIKNAKDKASKLLNAVDEEIGNLLEVSELEQSIFKAFIEQHNYSLSNLIRFRSNASYKPRTYEYDGYSYGEKPIDFQEVKLTTIIKVKYEIKNEK